MTDLRPQQAGSTRDQLLRAARDQFAAKGFVGARLTDIAAGAGMTTGAYYRHFAAKVEIVEALFDEFAAELSLALVDVPDLVSFCRAWLQVHERHSGTVRATEDVTLQDDAHRAHRRRLRTLWASSALPHLHALEGKQRRLLSLVLVDTLDYYFLTRTRGWAAGSVDDAAANMAYLFTEGLYGDAISHRSGGRPRYRADPETPGHLAERAVNADTAALLRWKPAKGRINPTSPRGQAQRNAILRSGAQVFLAHSYENTTIPHIAAHAGVSPGTVYRYFQDKRDLFLCLLSGAERVLYEETIWPLGPDGRLQVRAGLDTYFATRNRERAVYRVWRELLETDEQMEHLWVATRQDFQGALERVISRSQSAGIIPTKYDSRIVAEILVALCDGPAHAWFDLGWKEQGENSAGDLADVVATRIGDY